MPPPRKSQHAAAGHWVGAFLVRGHNLSLKLGHLRDVPASLLLQPHPIVNNARS